MVDELIEVSVVAEDHMASDIEKEAFSSALRARKTPWSRKAINQEPIGMFVLKSESPAELIFSRETWWSLVAAPSPVVPAPITRTPTRSSPIAKGKFY